MKYLKNTLQQLSLPCGVEIMERFETYRRRVLEWNEAVNLTAIKDEDDFEAKHFVDSLAVCQGPGIQGAKKIIDVGTGAGFPGIPLAIVFPEKHFTLMDSLGKRMKIVAQLSEEIGLTNVEIIHARAEDLAREKEHRERYDLCVSRAVANLAVLSEYCLPFVKVGGWFAPYKTTAAEEEIQEGRKALALLGGQLVSQTCLEKISSGIEETGQDHIILWIQKNKPTLVKYPRKAGMPAKEPLK